MHIVSFSADVTEQTTGKPVVLTWEIYNGTSMSITGGTTTFNSTQRSTIRSNSSPITMGKTDTTYVLTVTGPGGATDTRSVTVTASRSRTPVG